MGAFAANGDKLVLGRGAVHFDRFTGAGASTGLRLLGNVEEMTISTTDETVDKYSSVEANSPLLASVPVRRTVELVLTLSEWQAANLALALMGNEATVAQSSGTAATVTLADVKKGRAYEIGAYRVTNVVVKVGASTKTLNTDYTLDATFGVITILASGGILDDDDVVVTYDKPAKTISKVQGGAAGAIKGALRFYSDNLSGPNYRLAVWKCSVIPEGETGFISDEFGNYQLRLKVLDDSVNHPGEGLYTLEEVPA